MDKLEREATSFYNKAGAGYHKDRVSKKRFWNDFLEMPATLSLLGHVKNKKILDVGCGTGIYAKILNDNGAKVHGIDISPKMIQLAKSYVKNVDLKVGSAYRFPYKSNYFDIVVSALVIEHLSDLDKAFREIKRVLKKGGVFVFSLGNPVIDASHPVKGKPNSTRNFENYFRETIYTHTWGKKDGTKVRYMHRTYETIIRTIIRNGFSIEDYIDAKPVLSGRKVDKNAFESTSRLPYVCVFRVRSV